MRPWRKLHAGIINSDKLANVSDSAAWLFALLVVAQDDAGWYPWTAAKVRSLCVGRPWNGAKITMLLKELVAADLVELRGESHSGSMLHIIDGEAKNGKPRDDRPAFHYDAIDVSADNRSHTADNPLTYRSHTTDIPVDVTEKIRLEEINLNTHHPSLPLPTRAGEDDGGVCVSGLDLGVFGDSEQPRREPPAGAEPRSESAYAEFEARFREGNGGHFGDKSDAGRAWFEYVTRPECDSGEVLAALAKYFASSEYADQRARSLARIGAAKWLAQWTDWRDQPGGGQPEAPAKLKPKRPIWYQNKPVDPETGEPWPVDEAGEPLPLEVVG